jgi:hypothetical protein
VLPLFVLPMKFRRLRDPLRPIRAPVPEMPGRLPN